MSAPPKDHKNLSTRALGAGLTMAVTVGLFAFVGITLDDWLATSPVFILICTLLGVAGGFLHLVYVVAPDQFPFGRRRTTGSASDSGTSIDSGKTSARHDGSDQGGSNQGSEDGTDGDDGQA